MSSIVDRNQFTPGAKPPGPAVRVMRARPGWAAVDLRELWEYRAVLGFLVRRDLKIRYAQTALGAAWAIFQPLMPMLIFTVVFGVLGRIPSNGAPYALFVLTGLVAWTYFSAAVLGATNSLIANPELVTKVYFPRLAIPLAPLFAGLVDLAIGFAILFIFMAVKRAEPLPQAIVAVPALVLLMMTCAAGIGCWLSALNTRFRDVKHITPVLLQMAMYASPVVYPASLIPVRYRLLYSLNPAVGIIEGLRSVLLRTAYDSRVTLVSVAVSVTLLVSGLLYFRRTERVFADVV